MDRYADVRPAPRLNPERRLDAPYQVYDVDTGAVICYAHTRDHGEELAHLIRQGRKIPGWLKYRPE
jgi:hypothetical protein